MQRVLFIVCFTIFFVGTAQEKKISGKVISGTKPLANIHILNLTSKKGSFTNNEGLFTIKVNLNDSILISSIAHEAYQFKVSPQNLKNDDIIIHLKTKNTLLDEIVINKTKLTGNLLSDIKKTPRNYADELSLKINLRYKKLAQQISTPSNGLSFSIGGKAGKKRQKKRQLLEEKIAFPNNLIKHFGSYFFTEELKIPKDKIHNFIDYCMFKNILTLYKKKQLFELTRVLHQESINYLALNTTKE